MYTSYTISELKDIFATPRSVYFIGIGGISMSSLAHIAHSMGMRVGGYDRTASHLTKAFEAEGIAVSYELGYSYFLTCAIALKTVAIVTEIFFRPANKSVFNKVNSSHIYFLPKYVLFDYIYIITHFAPFVNSKNSQSLSNFFGCFYINFCCYNIRKVVSKYPQK
jgi:hypothetical protein